MRCEEIRDQLADRLTGALGERAERDVREHLSGCAECRREADAIEGLWSRLGAIPAEPADSAAMRERFYTMLEGDEQDRGTDGERPGWTGASARVATWWPRRPAFEAALAAALLVLGVLAGRQMPTGLRTSDDDIASLRRELQDVRQVAMLSLMQQQSASERLRGVSWSDRIDRPGDDVLTALLDTLMHDPNVNVRLACLDALAHLGDQPRVRRGVVEALGRDSSPLVQIALIDFVVDVREKASVQTLRRLAEDPTLNEAVRGRAAWGLQQLG
jgi:HEAT repeat protein